MESPLSEESLWASGLASRLRLIQANFADDPPSVRQGYIVEEIERALKPVSPTRRKAYLDTLAERFPAWESSRPAADQAPPPADPKVRAALVTPEEMVAGLIELAPTLPPEKRASFAAQLQAAGLVLKEASSPTLDLPPELQKRLGLPPGKPLQVERAVKLLAIVAEFSLALDQLAWALWKQINPKSAIRKEADLNRLASAYLTGDTEVSTAQLSQPVEKTRRLIAGLMGAVGRAGSAYAKKHVSRLSPEVIEDWAKMESRGWKSIEAACWLKYVQQAKEHGSEQAIEHEIMDAIAKAAENLILGRIAG